MSYLDHTGLAYFYQKVKGLMEGKMDRSLYDPQGRGLDVFGFAEGLRPKAASLRLPASAWAANTQTISVPGVGADSAVIPVPAPASWAAAGAAGVRCTAQAAGSLTFTCESAPTEDLTYQVLIQEVRT